MIELRRPDHSYFYGFVLCDGHLHEYERNRGRLALELKRGDEDIILAFNKMFPSVSKISYRTRDTNFKLQYPTVTLSICNRDFREHIKSLGYLPGSKSNLINVPNTEYSKVDFVRGIIDANGSVGFTEEGIPFISLTTPSEFIKDSYLEFLNENLDISKKCTRNKRDDIYNIVVTRTNAKKLHSILYYKDCVCLGRKNNLLIKQWVSRFPEKQVKHWLYWEIEYAKNHNIVESMVKLSRTKQSIVSKLNKLSKLKGM